jgi:hypothetical protein
MPSFGTNSKKHRETIDPRLQEIVDEAIKIFDFSIVCGFRNEEDQNKAYETKKSKLRWPQSKHNTNPSLAVDLAPWDFTTNKIDWFNHKRFIWLAGIIMGIAHLKGINIRWGGDWNRDTFLRDENFLDLAHFELHD